MVTVKAEELSCWTFQNVPIENCSLFTEKKTESRNENEPENPPGKERKSEEKETRRRKTNNGCTLSFYVDFFRDNF